jgi:hypothetical protein
MTFQRAKTEISKRPALAKIDGAISAAFIASGIGCFVIGLMTTGAVISGTLKSLLEWSKPVGPLSGKTGVGIIVWLASWGILHVLWKERESNLRTTMIISLILVGLGVLLTFPPVFEAFE